MFTTGFSKTAKRCWTGYKPVKGKEPYAKGSCEKVAEDASNKEMVERDVSNIERKAHYLKSLIERLSKSKDCPPWVVSKTTQAKTHIQDVMDYVAGSKVEKTAEKKEKPFHGYNKARHNKDGGLNKKFREKYNREHGSHLQAPVTEKNPTGKKAARRKSFCARMSGNKGPLYKDGKPTPKLMSLRKWKCSGY